MRALDAAGQLAVAIEHARRDVEAGRRPEDATRDRFLDALLRLIHEALRPDHGDPTFQAQVLRHRHPSVDEYAQLAATAERDRRQLRLAIDAVAHPGKWRGRAPGPLTDAIHRLHAASRLASDADADDQAGDHSAGRVDARIDDVVALSTAIEASIEALRTADDESLRTRLRALPDHPALARLRRLAELAVQPEVLDFNALLAQQGPAPGSALAIAQGDLASQRGDATEAATADAVRHLARWLDAHEQSPGRHRVVQGLLAPADLPGDGDGAKNEWDVALLRRAEPRASGPDGQDGPDGPDGPDQPDQPDQPDSTDARWDLLLLLEAKASPDAAPADLPGLLRGLVRLSGIESAVLPFRCRPDGDGYGDRGRRDRRHDRDGEDHVLLTGDSLRALRPVGDDLPPQVLYSCDAPAEARVRLLSVSSRTLLLSEDGCVAVGARIAAGAAPVPDALLPVWERLPRAARLAPVLHQRDTMRRARAAMIHPKDLLAALAPPH